MSLSLITAPASEPVSPEEIKAYLRVTTPDDDNLISSLMVTARHALEARAGIAFLHQDWVYTQEISQYAEICLPLSPVSAINLIQIKNTNDAYIDISLDEFEIELGLTATLSPTDPFQLLHYLDASSTKSIKIGFTAGFSSKDQIPADLRHSLFLLTAHFYENRESASEERVFSIPRTVDALLAPYRRVKL